MSEIKTIADLKPDRHNANLGTERGRYMIETSLERHGAGRSILADRDGNVIAGNKTLEVAAEKGIPARFVETDGTELVVVVRKDVSIDDENGRGLAYSDNRASEVGLAWDPEQLARDQASGQDLLVWFRQDEIDELTTGFSGDGAHEPVGLAENYSRKIEAPIYTPKGEKPAESELYDRTRALELLIEIEAADLPSEVADFLRHAAERHTVFRFDRIAEYYAHAPAEVQSLMERSALIIIDFNQAVELGYVKLTEKMLEQAGYAKEVADA